MTVRRALAIAYLRGLLGVPLNPEELLPKVKKPKKERR